MKLHEFRVTAPAKPGTESEVVVDGEPWHKAYSIKSVAVTHTMGEVTQLYVTLTGDAVIEGEGIVTQVIEQPGADVAEWLEQIDPEALSDAVSQALSGLDYHGESAEMLALQVLKDWAHGH